MSHLEISNPGGIADKELGASLTGSTTLVKSSKDVLGGNKIIIDFGMHQGSENAGELNKEIPKDLIDADVLIITHAHMDHIGRVPQLVKAGFKGRIIMSPFTKALAKHMWTDYINVIQREIEKTEHYNTRIWKEYNEYLKFVNNYEKLKQTNLEKKTKRMM